MKSLEAPGAMRSDRKPMEGWVASVGRSGRHLKVASFLGAIACLQAIGLAAAPPFTSPALPHVTSWIGNTYPGAGKWVQQDIHAMAVTDDGTVFTNVEWDEGGGQAGEYRDGELIRYARHTHGWGANGGLAVAVNAKYVFIALVMGNEGGGLKDENTWPPKGSKWFGISRRLRSDIAQAAPFSGGKGGKGDTLKSSFLVVAEVPEKSGSPLAGLCADNQHFYVADPNSSLIKVYDCETMQLVKTWKTSASGPMAMDARGNIWLLTKVDGMQVHFRRFTRSGGALSSVVLQDCSAPTCFAISRDGDVFVFDDTADQQVRIYHSADQIKSAVSPPSGSAPVESLRAAETFGVKHGIFAAPAGAFSDAKLNHVMAMGCDARGNLYLAHDGQTGGGGTILESYALGRSPAGQISSSKLIWRLFGLTFVDMADADPASDTEVFTKEEHFSLDYSKPPGQAWTYAGYTVDPFRYPQDPRIFIWSANAWVRRIAGQRVLFVSDMNGDELQVYRFSPKTDGEIAIPSGFFAKRHVTAKKDPTWPLHQPDKGEWLWRDLNGNGAFDPGEYTQPPVTGSSRGNETLSKVSSDAIASSRPSDTPSSQGWWVDSAGGVWLATETKGIRYFPSAGLDARGNPVWSYDTMRTFPHLSEFKQVKRVRYDPDTDTLYLAGTTDEHKNQHWKPGGPVIARYDHWLRGKGERRWTIVAPYASGSSGHTSCEPMGFDLAGDFLFVPYTGASKPDNVKHGRVEILRRSDGSSVGHIEPAAEVGEIGLQDIRECLRAIRRSDGEYVVFLEDDYKSKVVLYRLKLE